MGQFTFQLDEFYFDLEQNGNRIVNLSREQLQQKPFPGLRPFKTSEYQIFKGRDGQSEELIRRLEKNYFLAVVGSSGTGKSSLVRAGLIPQLLGGYLYSAGTQWKIAICRPGKDPIENLAVALASTKCGSTQQEVIQKDFEEVNATLRRSIYGLLEVSETLTLKRDGESDGSNLLVIVDQFEELFRFKRTDLDFPNIEDHFVNLLLKAAFNIHSSIYVVITMRSEFLGDSIKYRGLPEAINQGQYLVPQLDRIQLKQVIEEPIGLASKTISEGLVELLVNEIEEGKLKENADQLPILQHALMRTYQASLTDNTEGAEICYENYKSVGGMRHALANHAEFKYTELKSPSKQQIAKLVFQSITDLSTDQKGGRKPTELKNIYDIAADIGASPSEVDEVINQFRDTDTSFIMPPINTPLSPNLIIDISHESLMRNWQRLNEWINEDARLGRLYKILDERRTLKESGKDLWLQGGLLEEITNWKKLRPSNYAWAKKINQSSEHEYNRNLAFLQQSNKNKNKHQRWIAFSLISGFLFLLAGIVYFLEGNSKMRAIPTARREILALTKQPFYRSGIFSGSVNDSLSRDSIIDLLITTKVELNDDLKAKQLLDALNELSKYWDIAARNPTVAFIKIKAFYNPALHKPLNHLFLKVLNKYWYTTYSEPIDQSYRWYVFSKDKQFMAVPESGQIKLFRLANDRITLLYSKIFHRRLSAISVRQDGSLIVVADDRFFQWDAKGYLVSQKKIGQNTYHYWQQLSPDGEMIAIVRTDAASSDAIDFSFNSNIKPIVINHQEQGNNSQVSDLQFSPDSRNLLLTRFDYDSSSYKVQYLGLPRLNRINLPKGVLYATFTDDGNFLLVKQNDEIKILDRNAQPIFSSITVTSKQTIAKAELSSDWKQLLIQYKDDPKLVVFNNVSQGIQDSVFSKLSRKGKASITKREIPVNPSMDQPTLLEYPLMIGIVNDKLQVVKNLPVFKSLPEAFEVLQNETQHAQPSLAEKIEFSLINVDTITQSSVFTQVADYYYSKYGTDTENDLNNLNRARYLYQKATSQGIPKEKLLNVFSTLTTIINYQFSADSSYRNMLQNLQELISQHDKFFQALPADSLDVLRVASGNYADAAWCSLMARKTDDAIAYSLKGLELSPKNDYASSSLALGYLLNGNASKATDIYLRLKKKDSDSFFKGPFLTDFNTLEKKHIIPQGDRTVAAIKDLLSSDKKKK